MIHVYIQVRPMFLSSSCSFDWPLGEWIAFLFVTTLSHKLEMIIYRHQFGAC